MSKCGKCRRYMKYIAARPSRLYCPVCEDVYALPQGGAVKQYKGLECPLDGFELVLFSLSGSVSCRFFLYVFCLKAPVCPAANACICVLGATHKWAVVRESNEIYKAVRGAGVPTGWL
jgi:hypothetical protein